MTNLLSHPTFGPMFLNLHTVGTEKSQNINWDMYESAMKAAGLGAESVVALSWGRFSTMNIEALTESTTLISLSPTGVFASTGKKKLLGGVKSHVINFSQVRSFGGEECVIEHHRIYKFCIEFAGPGGILLGRLEWLAQARRFGDNRQEVMDAASERDRCLEVIQKAAGL